MNTKDKAQPDAAGTLPTDAMVNAAEDIAYASMPWHGPDEMREGVYEMVRAALAARQPAGRYLEDRVIETSGAKCMDDFDHELSKAEKLLATHPQPAAAKEQGNA